MSPEDLASHDAQRRVAHALHAVRAGTAPAAPVRDAVLASWLRSRQHGIAPALGQAPLVLDDESLARARDDAEWLAAAHEAVAHRSAGFDYDGHIVALFDARGRFLAGDGDRDALDGLADINFRPGALWTEAAVGTNGPGTALATAQPVHIVGTEHFCEAWQPWHCAAVPLRDPVDGAIVGVLDVSGAAHRASSHVRQLAHVLAVAVEQALGTVDALRRVRLLEQLTELTGRYPHDPVVVLDRRGRVVGATRQVPRALQRDGTRAATLHDALGRLGTAPVERSVRIPLADDVEIEALARPVLVDGRCIGSTLQLLAVAEPLAGTPTLTGAAARGAHAPGTRTVLDPRDVGRLSPVAGVRQQLATGPANGARTASIVARHGDADHPDDRGTNPHTARDERLARDARAQREPARDGRDPRDPRDPLRTSGEHPRPARGSGTHGTRFTFADIVGTSPALREAVRIAHAAARNALPVLLLGESGTGKEVVAQSIHAGSARAARPFVAVNCAAIPRELIEAELFGYVGGAFSGARRDGSAGKFEAARGGTIFLDEIGELTPAAQAALLRALQEGEITRVGATGATAVDVRVIAATNRDPQQAMHAGLLREDLFYRLNVLSIELPPLRARAEDLPSLVLAFLDDATRELGASSMSVSREAMLVLERWPWPGNVRELKNLVRRLVALAGSPLIDTHDLPAPMRGEGAPVPLAPVRAVAARDDVRAPARVASERARPATWRVAPDARVTADDDIARDSGTRARDTLLAAIADAPTMADAARRLGITRSTLYRRLEALGLRPGRGVR
ncbi:MAG: sigma 54-interacting transcriptional regulator [Gemmatimonadaceae bacterium]|nr:sigma 54-interacting transcriptional regulator [Gemmatimonadaceae bacterium]